MRQELNAKNANLLMERNTPRYKGRSQVQSIGRGQVGNRKIHKRSVRKSPPVCSLRLLAREAPPMRGMRVVIHVQGAESRVVVRQITAHAVDPIVSRSRR